MIDLALLMLRLHQRQRRVVSTRRLPTRGRVEMEEGMEEGQNLPAVIG
jgi:hypothetical protein